MRGDSDPGSIGGLQGQLRDGRARREGADRGHGATGGGKSRVDDTCRTIGTTHDEKRRMLIRGESRVRGNQRSSEVIRDHQRSIDETHLIRGEGAHGEGIGHVDCELARAPLGDQVPLANDIRGARDAEKRTLWLVRCE